MNRIAGRAWIALILVAVLVGGMVFFMGEYFLNARDWVLFPGSPHVYNGGKLRSGMLLDRTGALLLDYSQGRTYAPDAALRKAMLHWTGDRQGNISVPAVSNYFDAMVGFDPVNGVYSYGDTAGRMTLTLSADVQLAALEALGDHKGTIAVYNYKTGEIICAVSTPNFDPEDVPDIAGDTEGVYEGVYLNRFIQSAYIPGSIFKIVTLAAAVESVPDILEHTFTCTTVYEIASGGDVTCEELHGEQTLKQAFANSCNCAFAQIVELIGAEKLVRYVELFGITEVVRFDGITTVQGNFDLSGASDEQVCWSGIGQHTDQINPCAFLRFVGAVASGGSGVEPYVVQNVKVGSATYTAATQKRDRIMSRATAELVAEYMANNVQVKYGANNYPGLTVCAKTGTGQVGGDRDPNAMMTGFVADEKYPFAFIIAIENGGYGGTVCVPILSQVLASCKEMADG